MIDDSSYELNGKSYPGKKLELVSHRQVTDFHFEYNTWRRVVEYHEGEPEFFFRDEGCFAPDTWMPLEYVENPDITTEYEGENPPTKDELETKYQELVAEHGLM